MKVKVTLATIVIALVTGALSAPPSQAAENADARASTVGVITRRGGETLSSNLGVVILTKAGTGYVVTCDSAIAAVSITLNPVNGRVEDVHHGDPLGDTAVVLFSGATRTSVAARIIARDTSRNLAVLTFKCPPEQASLSPFGELPKLSETDLVRLCVEEKQGEGTLKFESVEITALRRVDGKPALVQFGGELAARWTGAPMIDQAGQLIGIASSSIDRRGISFAITTNVIAALLDGSIGRPAVRLVRQEENVAQIEVEVPLIDPLERFSDLDCVLTRAGKPPRTVALRRDAGAGAARATVDITGEPGEIVSCQYSVRHTRADGKKAASAARELAIEFAVRRPETEINPLRQFGFDRKLAAIEDAQVPSPLATGFEIEEFAGRYGSGLRRIAEGSFEPIQTPPEEGVFFALREKAISKVRLNDAKGLEDRKIGGHEIARLYLPQEFDWIVHCKDGIAAGSRWLNQLWLIDPDSLKVKKRIAIAIFDSKPFARPEDRGLLLSFDGDVFHLDLQTLQISAPTSEQLQKKVSRGG